MKTEKLIIGVLLVCLVGVSGCTGNGTETVVKEIDVGGSSPTTVFVTVPDNAKIRVEISNVTIMPNPSFETTYPSLSFNGLDVEGQNGQTVGNYQGHLKDVKIFNNLTNGFAGNSTFKEGIKSVGIMSNEVMAHVKIVAIT